jgi:hypothetical protein
MGMNHFVRLTGASILALGVIGFAGLAGAAEPSKSAIKTARELIVLKGSDKIYDPILPGIIEQAKATLLQVNPMVSKELDEVAAKLQKQYAKRISEPLDEMAKLYASRFTEQELKDALAFYKTPLGKKIIVEEPAVLEQSVTGVHAWANRLSEEILIKFRTEMKSKGHEL